MSGTSRADLSPLLKGSIYFLAKHTQSNEQYSLITVLSFRRRLLKGPVKALSHCRVLLNLLACFLDSHRGAGEKRPKKAAENPPNGT